MPCPLPGCESQDSTEAVRYGSCEVDCPACGRFKISNDLYDAAQLEFSAAANLVDKLRRFIRARNVEGKVPLISVDNWRILAAGES